MKIYVPDPPPHIIRLQISKAGENAEYLTLSETTAEETIVFLKDLISKQNISIFEEGRVTSIVVREAEGGKNGKSKTVSFKGLTPLQVKELIEDTLK